MQEWQYSGGIILARLFEPSQPEWRVILGTAAEAQPVYAGAHAYRVQGGPVINIDYKDIAFISAGDGIGYNFLRGDHYRVGAALAFDLGRRERDDYANLRGMGDSGPSITLATRRYLQSEFGVTPAQSLASGHPVFDAHAGMAAVGVGFSATRFLTDHWLLNTDLAISKFKGSPDVSPITETSTQRVIALSLNYQW